MPPTDTTDSKIAMLNDTCGNLIQLTQLMRYRASAQAGLDCCGFRRHVEDASTMRQSRVNT